MMTCYKSELQKYNTTLCFFWSSAFCFGLLSPSAGLLQKNRSGFCVTLFAFLRLSSTTCSLSTCCLLRLSVFESAFFFVMMIDVSLELTANGRQAACRYCCCWCCSCRSIILLCIYNIPTAVVQDTHIINRYYYYIKITRKRAFFCWEACRERWDFQENGESLC